MKAILPLLLLALAVPGIAETAPAQSPTHAAQAAAPKAQRKARGRRKRLTRKQAVAVVRAGVKGKIVEGELEKEAGRLIWSFDVKTKSGIREVWVDPYSGKIIEDKTESAAKERGEKLKERREKQASTGAPADSKRK
ncbi:MAG: PepSY domain-containing protein [Elusimicrobia bacterium]|nr:PepSY domain-containing protein [Elusimicrobiota bacterium]